MDEFDVFDFLEQLILLTFALCMKAQAMVSNVTWEIIEQLEQVIDSCRQMGYEMELILALFSVG